MALFLTTFTSSLFFSLILLKSISFCIITAPVLLNACLRVWYTKCVFTRLVRVYTFGVPTTRLRVWCTFETLTNQGEAHQYIDLVVCFNTEDSHHHPNKHIILYVFYAPRSDSLVLLN